MHKNFRYRFINFQSIFFQNINLQQKFHFNNLEKCTSTVFTSIIIIEKNYRILRIKPMSDKFIAINDSSSSFLSRKQLFWKYTNVFFTFANNKYALTAKGYPWDGRRIYSRDVRIFHNSPHMSLDITWTSQGYRHFRLKRL